jgi:hypothetical protein
MLNGRALLLLLVLLALGACAAEARRSRRLKAQNQKGDFDFFFLVRCAMGHVLPAQLAIPFLGLPSSTLLVVVFFFMCRQWPATFCNDHACTHRPPKK